MNATGEESARIAWDQCRQCALPSTQPADLPSPAAFDAAVEHVSPSDILEKVRASADVGRQLAWLQEDLALGVEGITSTTSPPAIGALHRRVRHPGSCRS